MNTTHVESVRFLSVTEHETDSPIPDEWWDLPPLLFLEKAGWKGFVWRKYAPSEANTLNNKMVELCAEDAVKISMINNNPNGYEITVEVNR